MVLWIFVNYVRTNYPSPVLNIAINNWRLMHRTMIITALALIGLMLIVQGALILPVRRNGNISII
jgi:hypothetical protein